MTDLEAMAREIVERMCGGKLPHPHDMRDAIWQALQAVREADARVVDVMAQARRGHAVGAALTRAAATIREGVK